MMQMDVDIPDADTTCSICYAEFLDPDDLEIHKNQMHLNEVRYTLRKCQFCEQCFPDLEAYAYHIRDEHLHALKCCKYCNRIFNDIDNYRRHESKHYIYVNKSKYSCSQCRMLFTNIGELENHENLYHMNSDDGVFLNDCLPILSTLINIKASSFLQTLGDDVVYICVKCELTTVDVMEYLDHLKRLDCRSLACDTCSSVYRKRKGLLRHFSQRVECFHGMEHHYGRCKECLKTFKIKTLREHSKSCKPIKCKCCNIVFESMYDLSNHQSDIHPSAVVLQSCKYCHKDFAGLKSLDKHIERTHGHELHLYKYKCVYCNDIFKHPKNLFSHFFSTHKDLEPYICKICDKKFRIRKRFTIHIKLDHKSIGYIEFDDKYHVFFSDKKSDQPFAPLGTEQTETQDLEIVNETEIIIEGEQQQDDIGESVVTKEQESENDKTNRNTRKVQFDVEEKCDGQINLVNVNSDFMSATETEGEMEKKETKTKAKSKITNRKRPKKQGRDSDSSDDETLLSIQKKQKELHRKRLRTATWNRKKKKDLNDKSKRFICNICKKNCYTFQNYNNHVSLHYKNVTKCIKCSKDFNSKEELNDHYSKEHATSQLTETLRSLLEKRKTRVSNELSNREKFLRTIKKVEVQKDDVSATITKTGDKDLSVQKFIESFTPENEIPKKDIIIETNVSIKPVIGVVKEPTIKIIKCKLDNLNFESNKLAMPVKFQQFDVKEYKATLKRVLIDETPEENIDFHAEDNVEHSYSDAESIPEVAEEIMLEGFEETAKPIYVPHKVVIPELSSNCKDIHIAHLQPEAPFYKIVKVEEVLKNPMRKQEAVSTAQKKDIKLPDGTTLVSVNPLAHLLGNTPVEKILEGSRNKYYQHKPKDFETAIAKAMLKLNKPEVFPKKQRKKVVSGQE